MSTAPGRCPAFDAIRWRRNGRMSPQSLMDPVVAATAPARVAADVSAFLALTFLTLSECANAEPGRRRRPHAEHAPQLCGGLLDRRTVRIEAAGLVVHALAHVLARILIGRTTTIGRLQLGARVFAPRAERTARLDGMRPHYPQTVSECCNCIQTECDSNTLWVYIFF